MATVNYPTSRAFTPQSVEVQLRPQVRMAESIYTGQVASFETPFSAWWFTVTLTAQSPADRAAVEAWLHTVRGPANRVSMWHPMRPTPRGTQAANTVTVGTAALGASSVGVSLSGTVRAGDMMAVAMTAGGTALVQVTADVLSTGTQTVSFAPQLRGAVSNGATVTFIRPTALFVLREAPTIGYLPGEATPITLAFSEVFA